MTLGEAIKDLRRPYTPEAVKFKIQAVKGERAQIVAYIDARLAAARLNLVCPAEWEDAYEPVTGGMLCKLHVCGVVRQDVGWSDGTRTDIALKSLYSDAFKRACVKFGVGESLYALPRLSVPKGELSEWQGKYFLFDDSKAMATARASYTSWLDATGRKHFGDPFDHGEHAMSQGDIETEAPLGEPETPAVASGGVDPTEYVCWLISAIRSRDLARYDTSEKIASVLGNKSPDHLRRVVPLLRAEMMELDLDVEAVEQRFRDQVAA